MRIRLFAKRPLWVPTIWGWLLLGGTFAALALAWFIQCESFLRLTERRSSHVLVVEAWIGLEGLRAAADEARLNGDDLLITTGGLSSERWSDQRYSYAEMAGRELVRAGIDSSRIVVAPAVQVESQRTFQMAVAAFRAVRAKDLHPKAINVFTVGAHARRSRLVFAKVFGPDVEVGVISWMPKSYSHDRWWRSSERADEVLKESAAFLYELLLNSGRTSNSPR